MATSSPTDPSSAIPVVLVEGFLSSTGSIGWAALRSQLHGFKKHLGDRAVLVASVGPVSSLHDRACELYYCLRGGQVDYGEEHAQKHGHARYGRVHGDGLYPQWSASRPLHFLGHSLGGPTIVKLSSLLGKKFFGADDHPDMILSLTSVSAPFRGTQIVYALGEHTTHAPAVRPLSLGALLSRCVHVLAYLAPLLPAAVDLHAETRALSCDTAGVLAFLRQLWRSDWAEGRDATPYDMTFEASDDREEQGEGLCNARTYYRSYAAQMRVPESHSSNWPGLTQLVSLPFYIGARVIGTFDFTVLQPPPSFLQSSMKADDPEKGYARETLSEHYWANDGVVPVFSQWHPHECSKTKCQHYDGTIEIEKGTSVPDHQALKEEAPRLTPGMWHVFTYPDTHHLSVISLWLGTPRQESFWLEMQEFLSRIDHER